ncbi:hypothetical protein DPEC_G00277810 [Dallia pectoralis]|uniref:Uncharacterized protein n=1 Tax=Dallia pectoralis TaxID=75939 RepID=A0ACC2FLV4_DALPE|nr:hypothetical protein DPEC_G00277810 [Dallia pectoralis]
MPRPGAPNGFWVVRDNQRRRHEHIAHVHSLVEDKVSVRWWWRWMSRGDSKNPGFHPTEGKSVPRRSWATDETHFGGFHLGMVTFDEWLVVLVLLALSQHIPEAPAVTRPQDTQRPRR